MSLALKHSYRFLTVLKKMSSLEKIKSNATLAEQTISALKNELLGVKAMYEKVRADQLREENAQLVKAIEEAKERLVNLETKNGVKQVPIPNQAAAKTTKTAEVKQAEAPKIDVAVPEMGKGDGKTDKKPKKAKEPKEKPAAAPEAPIDVGRLDMRVAKVKEVEKHPDADSLYVLKIDCGEPAPRTVCSGLVKFITKEELQDRSIVLLCNLKPVKMRGVTSEAMVMCASTPEKVEVLSPPSDTNPGDLVHCEGYDRQPDNVMNPKKKIFETVAPDLHTNGSLVACYKEKPLHVPGKGEVVAQTLKNVAVK